MPSQIYEGGANGSEDFVKSVPPASDPAARKEWLRKSGWSSRNAAEARACYERVLANPAAEPLTKSAALTRLQRLRR